MASDVVDLLGWRLCRVYKDRDCNLASIIGSMPMRLVAYVMRKPATTTTIVVAITFATANTTATTPFTSNRRHYIYFQPHCQ